MPRRIALLTLTAICSVVVLNVASCSRQDALQPDLFVGKWRSSRLTTPLYMRSNGEWEIKTDEGAVLQYGVWELKDRKLIWRIKVRSEIDQDINAVLSAKPQQFRLREANGSVTTFDRLDVIQ